MGVHSLQDDPIRRCCRDEGQSVRPQSVAYLPDQDAVTLKRIYREKNRIKLVPANSAMKPFYETNIEIQGRVIGILRKEV